MNTLGFTKRFLFLSNVSIWGWLGGAILNKIVLHANQGFMPVAEHGHVWPPATDGLPIIIDSRHILMTTDTHLNFLSDYISYLGYWNSVGDLMMDLATLLALLLGATLVNLALNKFTAWMAR